MNTNVDKILPIIINLIPFAPICIVPVISSNLKLNVLFRGKAITLKLIWILVVPANTVYMQEVKSGFW